MQFTEEYRKFGDVEVGQEQVDAINFMLSRRSSIVSLQTGLGKTLAVMVANKIIQDTYPSVTTIIVVPVKAVKSFKREIKRIGYKVGDIGIISTAEVSYDLKSNKIFLFTDTNIVKYSDLLEDIKREKNNSKFVLIVDEAHKLQDPKSAFSKTMVDVRGFCSVFIGLTATPILNSLDSLYHIVSFFAPGFLGRKTQFDNEYTIWHLADQYIKGGAKIKIRVLDGYKNLHLLKEKLNQIMIVRQKQYDLKYATVRSDMSEQEYKIYEKVSSGILNFGEDERNFSRRMHDLQRFIDRAYDGDSSIKELVSEYNEASKYSTKENMLLNTLAKALSQGYNVIIYSDYKDTVERLNTVLKSKRVSLGIGRIYEITGSVNIKIREAIEDRLDKNDVVLITSAGTESINLQRCNCIIFYDISFSTKTMIQAIGRVCRRDSLYKYQYIILLVMNNTIDEYKFRLFQNNLDLVQQSVGAGSDIPLNEKFLLADSRDLRRLKDELLWAYKGSPIKKQKRKEKQNIKANIDVSTVNDVDLKVSTYKFLIEPIDNVGGNVVKVPALYPDENKYRDFINKKIPFTVLRASYLEFLRSDRGKRLVKTIQKGVMEKGSVVLVGNTDIPKVLKQEVLDQFQV